ncbi:hypothetical protein AB6A40_000981 [Gnathostoma spinigerum]|uniref:Uncharacterized protein n=1 Tax=Gnathostoma spinigerum TaxID=75299 RepID=A0ABD6ECN9_9BILA
MKEHRDEGEGKGENELSDFDADDKSLEDVHRTLPTAPTPLKKDVSEVISPTAKAAVEGDQPKKHDFNNADETKAEWYRDQRELALEKIHQYSQSIYQENGKGMPVYGIRLDGW